jgi:hypothetical protein
VDDFRKSKPDLLRLTEQVWAMHACRPELHGFGMSHFLGTILQIGIEGYPINEDSAPVEDKLKRPFLSIEPIRGT